MRRFPFALRLALSLGVAALLVALLFHFGGVSPADTLRTLGQLSPATYALAPALRSLSIPTLLDRRNRKKERREM